MSSSVGHERHMATCHWKDTWHIVSDSRGATCHMQEESNMSSSLGHERHMATCHWKEIHVKWMRG